MQNQTTNERKIFAKQLKLLRHKSGLSQEKVADILNIDRSTYSYYEIGKTEPNLSAIIKLSDIFQVTTDCLFGKSDSYEKNNTESSLHIKSTG